MADRMDGLTAEEIAVFAAEAEEQLNAAEDMLLQLESDGVDRQAIERLLRAMHTLKGNAASIGWEDMARLAHAAEDAVIAVRDARLQTTASVMDVLLRSVDAMRAMAEGEQVADAAQLVDEIARTLQTADAAGEEQGGGSGEAVLHQLTEAVGAEDEILQVEVDLTDDIDMPAVRALQVLMCCESLGEILASDPTQKEVEEGRDVGGKILCYLRANSSAEDEIKREIRTNSGVARVSIQVQSAQRLLAESAEALHTGQDDDGSSDKDGKDSAGSRHIRVDVTILDRLMNLAGEMVINRNRLSNLADDLARNSFADQVEQLQQTVEQLSRVTGEVQQNIMQMRLVPLDRLFRRYPRMMRDLQQSQDKEFDFEIRGGQTEIDRSLLEVISDPLTHLLRNAVDHGIEPPEERLSRGKKRRGSVVLSASRRNNHICIEVSDDGRGIDTDAVVRRAVQKDVIDAEQAKQLNEQDIIGLMFSSGFSTTDEVTEISGRGVGLDVVRREVESVGGDISVDNDRGQGACFRLSLPLTVTSVKSLLVEIRGQTYVLPLGSVRETLVREPGQVQKAGESRVLQLRSELIRLFELADIFPSVREVDRGGPNYVVILEVDQRKIGFVVDDLIGEEECVIKPLLSPLDDIRGVSSATILPDGDVALILDASGLAKELLQDDGRVADEQSAGGR